MTIQINPNAKMLRPAHPCGDVPPPAIYKRFRSFLQMYESHRFLFLGRTPDVIQALGRMAPRYRELLGDRYLGLALGGSLVRGLASPSESDIDYILFVGGVDPGDRDLFGRIRSIEDELKKEGLKPCDLLHMHDLVHDVTFGPEVVASVFANYFVDLAVPEEKILQLVGQTIGRWKERYARRGLDLGRQLRESYQSLSGCDPMYVAAKFFEKRVRGVDSGNCGMSLVPEHIREKMVNIARPYLARREQNFPFPEEILT